MKVKPLITGALRPNPIKIDDDNSDTINPPNTIIPTAVANGKSYVNFNGTDEFITGPNTFRIGTGDFTVAEWIKCPSNIHLGNIFHYGPTKSEGNSSNYMYIGFGRQAAVFFPPRAAAYLAYCVVVKGGSTVISHFTTSSDQTDLSNQWIHIAFVCDRSDITTAYLNGSPIPGSVSNTMTTNDATLDLALNYGKANVGTGDFFTANGFGVADTRWYSKAFTADEITALYNESISNRTYAVSSNIKGRLRNMWTYGDTKGDVTNSLPALFNDVPQCLNTDNYPDDINNFRNPTGNVIENGDFSSALDSSQWTVTVQTGTGKWAVESGACKSTLNLSVLNAQTGNTVVGGLYQLTFNFTGALTTGTGATVQVYYGDGTLDSTTQVGLVSHTSSSSDNGSVSFLVRSINASDRVSFVSLITGGQGSASAQIDNVVLKRFSSNALNTENIDLDDLKKQKVFNKSNGRLNA